MTPCPLCQDAGGELLWRDAQCRVVRVGGEEGERFPGFCRVVWNAHVAEMSDLPAADRARLARIVDATERALRSLAAADKINLASLGNVVPHLHWHVIPRWRDDSHFPQPVWAPALRPIPTRAPLSSALLADNLRAQLGAAVAD